MQKNIQAEAKNAGRMMLRRNGYPPDKQEKVIQTVIEQAESLSEEWANV